MTGSAEMPSGDPAAIRVGDTERNQTVERLNAAVGEGRLTLAEFSDRVDAATAAKTQVELDKVLADLPALSRAATAPSYAPAPAVRPEQGERQEWHVSPLGGLSRKGRWRMRRKTTVVTIIGGVDLDLRNVEFAAPVVDLDSFSIIGGVSIVVPPGVDVEVSGFSLLGGRDVDVDHDLRPGAPTLRIRAFSILGGISVETKNPR